MVLPTEVTPDEEARRERANIPAQPPSGEQPAAPTAVAPKWQKYLESIYESQVRGRTLGPPEESGMRKASFILNDWYNRQQQFFNEYQAGLLLNPGEQYNEIGNPVDWDYANPAKLGPLDQPLPEGAVGWRPDGDADWGDGFAGKLKKAWYNFNYPNEVTVPEITPIPEEISRIMTESVQASIEGDPVSAVTIGLGGFFNYSMQLIKNSWSALESAGTTDTNIVKSNIFGTLARGTALVVNSLFGAFQASVEAIKKEWIGPGLMASDEIMRVWYEKYGKAAGSDLMQDVDSARKLGALTSFAAYPQALAFRIKYPDLRDEYEEVITEIKDLEAARMAGTAWFDPAAKEEFMRRARSGDEDLRMLALELQNPGAEMVFEIIYDPLNFLGAATKNLSRIRQLRRAEYGIEVVDGLSDAVKAVTTAASTAETAGAANRATNMILDAVKGVRANISKVALERGVLKPLAMNKRVTVGRRVNDMLMLALGKANSKQGVEFLDIVHAWALLASDDVADIQHAIDIMGSAGMPWKNVFSQAGLETAIFMRELGLTDKGLDFSKVANAVTAAGDDITKLAEEFGKINDDIIKRAFPDVSDQIRINNKYTALLEEDAEKAAKFLGKNPLADVPIARTTQLVEKAHRYLQTKVFRHVANIQGTLYMGTNPFYMTRNAWGNFVPALLDQGPLAAIKGLVGWGTRGAVDSVGRMLGGVVPESMMQGIGAAGSATNKIGKGWWNKFSQLAQTHETRASAHIFRSAIEEVLRPLMRKGRVLEEVNISGLSRIQNDAVFDLLRHHYANTDEVSKALRAGIIKPGRNLSFLADDVESGLKQLRIYDEVLVELRKYGDDQLDEALLAIDGIIANRRRQGLLTAKEAAALDISDLDETARRVLELGDGIADEIGNGAESLFNKSVQMNRIVEQRAEKFAESWLDNLTDQWTKQIVLDAQAAGSKMNSVELMEQANQMMRGVRDEITGLIQKNRDMVFAEADDFRRLTIKYAGIKKEKGLITFLANNDAGKARARTMWSRLGLSPEDTVAWKGKDLNIEEILALPDWKNQLERRVWENYRPVQQVRFAGMRDDTIGYYITQAESFAVWLGKNAEDNELFDGLILSWNRSRGFDEARVLADGTAVFDKIADPEQLQLMRRLLDRDSSLTMEERIAAQTAMDNAVAADPEAAEKIRAVSVAEEAAVAGRALPELNQAEIDAISARVLKGEISKAEGERLIAALGAPEAGRVVDESKIILTIEETPISDGYNIDLAAARKQLAKGFDTEGIDASELLEIGEETRLLREAIERADAELARGVSQAPEAGGRAALAESLEDIRRGVLEQMEQGVETPVVHGMDGAPPTMTRMAFETQAPAEDMVSRLKEGLREHWDDQVNFANTPEVERQLDDLFSRVSTRATEAQATAISIANARRDFILHNYGKRYGIDLFAGYIWPYQFWHSRTYAKWMKRFLENPGILAAYSVYRGRTEEINAGMPDWMKHSVNVSELFGLNVEEPIWFNLEQSLNPLQGITGVDFNDWRKREDWYGRVLDDLNKFGPSVWTPYQMAMGLKYQIEGKQDASSRWFGRMWSPTKYFRDLTALADPKGLGFELDPFINLFSGGIGPYDRAKTGRQLTAMQEEGKYTGAELIDAAYSHSGPIWDEARAKAINQHAPNVASILAPFIFGSGFKRRTQHDAEIDRFYREKNVLTTMKDRLTTEEYRNEWAKLEQRYPFMDTLLLAKKDGPDRDEALAWNVLDRVPPAQSDDFTELVGIPADVLNEFYETKGDLNAMKESDRLRFMAGIIDLGALLDIPDRSTKGEWDYVGRLYREMRSDGEKIFGEDIWLLEDTFWGLYDPEDPSRADNFAENNQLLKTAMDWKQELIQNTPDMAAYYTSIDRIQKYYKRLMYSEAERMFGDDLWDHFEVWSRLGDIDSKASRQYWKDHPQLEGYTKFKDEQLPLIGAKLEVFGEIIPETRPPIYREGGEGPTPEALAPTNENEAWIESQMLQYVSGLELAEEEEQQLTLDEQQLMQIMGEPLFRLWQMGEPLPEIARRRLQSLGLNADGTLNQIAPQTAQPITPTSDDEFGPIPEDPIALFGQALIDRGLNEVKENQGGLTKVLLGEVVDVGGAKGYAEDEIVAWFIEAVGARDPRDVPPPFTGGGFVPENIELGGMKGSRAMIGQQKENIFSETTALHAAVGFNKFTTAFHRLIDKIGAIATREGDSPGYVWEHSSPFIKTYRGEGPMNPGQRDTIIHEFAHKAGDESDIDYDDFKKSVNRVLAQEQDPSTTYYPMVVGISEFPGIRLATRGQDYEWGGPGELYARMFEWSDGDLDRIPPILRKYFRRWLK